MGGFTLVELVLVLAILAMAAAVVSVNIGRSAEKARVRGEITRLQAALKHARQTSIMQREPVVFRLDPEQKTYFLLRGDELMGKKVQIGRSVDMSAEDITFFPKGNSTGGSIFIEAGEGRKYVLEVDSVTGKRKLKRF